jgi:hypothetical protein
MACSWYLLQFLLEIARAKTTLDKSIWVQNGREREEEHITTYQGHPEFLLNIVFMDIYFVPLKEGRHAKGAGQVLQNYVRASRIPKKKFVAKQFASEEICR